MGSRRDISKEISSLLLVVLCLLLGLSFCRQWLPAFGVELAAILYLVVYFIPIGVYNKTHRYRARTSLRLKRFKLKYLPFFLLFGLSVCLICALINLGCSALAQAMFGYSPQNNIVDLSSSNTGMLILTSVLLPAISEEFLLRGLVQGEYEKYGTTIGVILTALIFALFHTNPVQIPALFIAGVCYGVLTLLFKSVWPAVIAHAINNGVALLLSQKGDFIRYIFQDSLFIIMAVIFAFLLLIFTLKMLETVVSDQLGKGRKLKKSVRSLSYGDPLVSPYLWVFIVLCIGKMIYNGFFK